MKLKDSTFAIIAEKKDSISHKWFNENLQKGQSKPIGDDWSDIMEFQGGLWINFYKSIPDNYGHKIYTESEFEALLKSEQENGRFEQVLQKGIDNSRLNLEEKHKCKYCGGMFSGDDEKCYKNPNHKEADILEGVKVEAKADYSKEAFGTENIVINKPIEFTLNEPKQITISYNLAIEYLAERLNVDKGIIKIEMP